MLLLEFPSNYESIRKVYLIIFGERKLLRFIELIPRTLKIKYKLKFAEKLAPCVQIFKKSCGNRSHLF